MSDSKRDMRFVQWLGAEVPSEYALLLDTLFVQSFGGYGLADLPLPDSRCVIIGENTVLAHAGVQARTFSIHETVYHGFVLGAVCTHPSFRRHGLGTQVVEYCFSKLPSEEGDFVVLNCGEKVTIFYEKMGFNMVSPRARYIRNGVDEVDEDPVLAFSLKETFSIEVLEIAVFPMIDEF